MRKTIFLLLFISASFGAEAQYTPMANKGYQFKYAKIDSGIAIPFIDTSIIIWGTTRPGSIRCRPADSLIYMWNGFKWDPIPTSSYADAKVQDVINNGVIDIAPSQNAVFDALVLKQNSLGFTPENVANKENATIDNNTTKYPTVNLLKTGLDAKLNIADTAAMLAPYLLEANASSDWKLTGNAGTVDGTSFIGTTDAQPFNIRVGNEKSGRIDGILENTFFGYKAANSNYGDAGVSNTAIGFEALKNNTEGNYNTALGQRTLITNVSGAQNTAIGSGANVGNGDLQNATAIGAQSYVTANNSLVLGGIAGVNSALADTKVGIGTTAPTEKLHVAGNLRLVNGSQAAGRFLKTDANGLTIWADLPIGNYVAGPASSTDNAIARFDGTTGKLIQNSTVTVADDGYTIINNDNLGGTFVENSGIRLINSTPAILDFQQVSPTLIQGGSGYKTDLVAGSQSVLFGQYVKSVQGTTAPLGVWTLASNVNNAGWVDRMTITTNPSGTIVTATQFNGHLVGGNVSGAFFSSANTFTVTKSVGAGSMDGFISLNNTLATAGVPIQKSPRARYTGNVWDVGTGTSRVTNWIIENTPVSGNPVTAKLTFKHDLDGGGYTERFAIGSAGALYLSGSAGTAGQVPVSGGAGVAVTWGSVWSLTGNAGTSPASNFIGTTDLQPLNIRVNNQKSGTVDPSTENTFFGYQSGLNTYGGVGTANVFIGKGSAAANTNGNYNVAVGHNALSVITTGSYNTALGTSATASSSALSNTTTIGARAYASVNDALILGSINGINGATSDTKVGIGTTAPTERLTVVGNVEVTGNEAITGYKKYKQTTTPASPSSDTECNTYFKSNKYIIQYNDAGTVRYKYLDLTGTGVTWIHTTTAP